MGPGPNSAVAMGISRSSEKERTDLCMSPEPFPLRPLAQSLRIEQARAPKPLASSGQGTVSGWKFCV